ncbi:cell envelope integrity protein CreD [Kangiella sp. TOML190]|uniref:cell envelope integrity protein CreD n=1 Tax=Kangiella sp. TOML190 TaxID=2931351 RepID=UPI00203D8671|nr:cell envelope integrity protein CreD [Kangiella sp. TOML190]
MTDIQTIKQRFSHSISFKLAVIAFLLLLLQIPMAYVEGLIYERQSMQTQAQQDISQRWGGSQHIGAPILAVQYKKSVKVKDNGGQHNLVSYEYNSHILSEEFLGDINLVANKRYLGIYEVPVFTSKVILSGAIEVEPDLHLGQHDDWSMQQLFLPIKEMRGLKSIDKLLINNQPVTVAQQQQKLRGLTGLSIRLDKIQRTHRLNYHVELTLSGSEQFDLLPLAGQSQVTISSNWPSPSFVGNFLPEKRTINEQGFEALWQVNELNHNFGRVLKGDKDYNLNNTKSIFGVKIIIPANIYQVNERTVKYGLLIMLLTFAGFFLAEMFFKLKLHPFQYLLIGFALSIFFLLLLALSEYLRFAWAFLVSALAIILLISGYCSVVLGQRKRGFYTAVLFALLYGFIYIMVRAKQTSLLMGAIGIWLFLAAVMYLTRKINWYSVSSSEQKP